MNTRRRRLATSLGLTAVLIVIGAVTTIDRVPGGGALHAQQTSWRGLVVAPERRCTPYDADDYRYPQSVEERIVGELGGVYGPYTGRWFASKTETDIEHMVARSEAHDSGLCAADPATRRRFASDLLNLTLAGPRVNRYEKVALDAAEWLPAQNRCWFAARVVAVRQRYGLTIDQREADALDQVLAGCASTELITFARGAVPTPAAPNGDGVVCESGSRRASPASQPASPRASGARCGPYRNCTALRRDHPNGVPRGHCAYQRRMDRDNDGRACER